MSIAPLSLTLTITVDVSTIERLDRCRELMRELLTLQPAASSATPPRDVMDAVDSAPPDASPRELADRIKQTVAARPPAPVAATSEPSPEEPEQEAPSPAPTVPVGPPPPATAKAATIPTEVDAPQEPRRRREAFTITQAELDAMPTRVARLTKLELEAVRLVAAGLSQGEIADRLGCARGVVYQRLRNAREKLSAPEGPPPCKITGCTEPSAATTGMYGRLCETHKAEKQRRRGSQLAPAVMRDGGTIWCSYCRENRTVLHVEQHELENQREHDRQAAGRAAIAHLPPDPGTARAKAAG